jgi:hypothetical protein
MPNALAGFWAAQNGRDAFALCLSSEWNIRTN